MNWPAYPAYKDSSVEWIGEIPSGWSARQLRYICDVQTGDRDTVHRVDGGEFPFFIRSETVQRIDSWSMDCEAVLTPGDGAVGQVFHHYTGRFDFHQRVYAFFNFRGIDGRYFYYYLSALFAKVALDGSAKTTVDSLRMPLIKGFVIAHPHLTEQEHIVRFLDRETVKIDSLIDKQKQLIDTLREDRAATITHGVTNGIDPGVEKKDSGIEWMGPVPSHWKVRQIKWGGPVKRGASPRPIDDPKYFDDEGEWSWVRIADVSSSSGRLYETTQRLSELGSSLSVKLQPGSLFISIAGTVGKPCITEIPACIHDGFVYFPLLDIEPEYLYRIFEAGECYKGLGKLGTQLNLNTDTIGSIYIPIPPREEQQAIVRDLDDRCEKIDALIDKSTEMIETLREYRSALIANAVTGKIDVREAV